MHLRFVDAGGTEGVITSTWTVEYDGPFEGSIEEFVQEVGDSNEASEADLQEVLIDLPDECHLLEIELIETRDT